MALINTQTKTEFTDNVINSTKPVLVDFWADWCMPCKTMAPILEKISKTMEDKLDVVKVNLEESADNRALAQEYEVQGIPNMQLFVDGKVAQTIIGAYPEPVLIDEINKVLG